MNQNSCVNEGSVPCNEDTAKSAPVAMDSTNGETGNGSLGQNGSGSAESGGAGNGSMGKGHSPGSVEFPEVEVRKCPGGICRRI